MESKDTFMVRRHEVMAIVNMTPDSFYGGSRCMDLSSAAERISKVIEDGADIVDIGGCSTRPGSDTVDEREEWRRVEMGLSCVRSISSDVAVSVDTFRSSVVRRAYDKVGRVIVNDISASTLDHTLLDTVVELQLPVVLMHMKGDPSTMQSMCSYGDVAEEVDRYLISRAGEYERAGVLPRNIILDPGFGFAKDVDQNYRLLSALPVISGHGYRVLAGVSRKRMITAPLGISAEEAELPTAMIEWEALRCGASIIRTHDVKKAVQAVRLFEQYDRCRGGL